MSVTFFLPEPPSRWASPKAWTDYIARLEVFQKEEPDNWRVQTMLDLAKAMHPGAQKANPYHHGGGDERGGQFTTADDSTVLFEVAPDPGNKELVQRWKTLTGQEKLEVSNRVVKDIVPSALQMLHTEGTLENQFGGWAGEVNPSYALTVDDEHAMDAAKLLGTALSQEAMAVTSDHELEGLEKVGVVVVGLPRADMTLDGLKMHYENLAQIADDKGNMLIGGFSANPEHSEMHILNFTGKADAELAGLVDKQLGGRYPVFTDHLYSTLVEKGHYNDGHQETSGQGAASWRENANSLRQTAANAINGELRRVGKAARKVKAYIRKKVKR